MTGVDTDISQCVHTCRYRQTDADTRIARYSNRKTSIFIDTHTHTHTQRENRERKGGSEMDWCEREI